MKVGKVIGNVWATKKDDGLEGLKLLIVQEFDPRNDAEGCCFVAVDMVGAGTGENVLVAQGSSARVTMNRESPVDASIVGIIDELEIYE